MTTGATQADSQYKQVNSGYHITFKGSNIKTVEHG
jgi:hypothetical protein